MNMDSAVGLKIAISAAAARSLRRSNKRQLLIAKIEQIANDQQALAANVVVLKGRNASRLRVQNWRIIFRIEGDVLYVEEIAPRGAVYEERS